MSYFLYLFCGFSCSYAVQSDLHCNVAHVTLIKCLLILPGLVFLYHFMPIMIFENVTLKYWHLHINILVIFNLLMFIVVIIKLVILEQVYLAVTFIEDGNIQESGIGHLKYHKVLICKY